MLDKQNPAKKKKNNYHNHCMKPNEHNTWQIVGSYYFRIASYAQEEDEESCYQHWSIMEAL